jgi:hypothetical protein
MTINCCGEKVRYRRTSISGTTFSGKKCLAGQVFMLFDFSFPCYLTTFSGKKWSKREGYLCFFLSRLSKFSCKIVSTSVVGTNSGPSDATHLMNTVDSPQIGHAPDPGKPVALRTCPISRPQCKFNSELQIGQLSDSKTKIPTFRTFFPFFAQHSCEPDDLSPEEKASLLAM